MAGVRGFAMRLVRCFALLAGVGLFAPGVRAAEDCALVDRLPTYTAAGAVDGRAWDAVTLATEAGPLAIVGRTCMQHYTPMEGTDPASDFAIQGSYRDALKEQGAEIILAEDRLTVARRTANGVDTWVRIHSQQTSIDVTVVEQAAHRQVLSAPGGNDYKPLGHMPDYVAETPDRRAFDQRPFQVREGGDVREVVVQGARIEIDYALKEGGRPASDLDIQENYRTALRAAGGEILFMDDRNTTARLDRPGGAAWIKVWSEETAINVTVIEQAAHVPSLVPPSGHDHRRIGHMPGYVADQPEKRGLDEVIYPVQAGEEAREVKVQGARTEITYAPASGRMPASDLDIQLNYRAALAALGAQMLFTDTATTVARFGDSGRLVWVKVWSQETTITVSIVEEKAFKAAVKPIPAETLRTALEGRGRVALFLAFDFDQPNLKPETAAILAEVTRLLREMPGLRLLIESHTDNVGPPEHNRTLAAARAGQVRDVLAASGADPARLAIVGIGSDRPITDNATSEARARNRRTVLIRQ